MTPTQKEAAKHYPLVMKKMLLWAIPAIVGIAAVILFLVVRAPIEGTLIGIASGAAFFGVGLGGFLKQFFDRKSVLEKVVEFRSEWGGVGKAPIAFRDETSGGSTSLVRFVIRSLVTESFFPSFEGRSYRLMRAVYTEPIAKIASEKYLGQDFHMPFLPITFVTVYDGEFIERRGRKFNGVIDGKWIDVVTSDFGASTLAGLIVHELKHRVIESVHPEWPEDVQHQFTEKDILPWSFGG